MAWYSALTNPDQFPVPRNESVTDIGTSIPITYVPLRNTIFLSLSAAYLESEVLHGIEVDGLMPEAVEAHIYMAPNAIDYSGYPDCRPEFYEKDRLMHCCTAANCGRNTEVPIRTERPQ